MLTRTLILHAINRLTALKYVLIIHFKMLNHQNFILRENSITLSYNVISVLFLLIMQP